jgi:hypothetical protein
VLGRRLRNHRRVARVLQETHRLHIRRGVLARREREVARQQRAGFREDFADDRVEPFED